MKRRILTAGLGVLSGLLITAGPAFAGGHAPGQAIKQACGLSFGQLVASAQPDSYHSNYAGGAKAFSDPAVLAAHGCTAAD